MLNSAEVATGPGTRLKDRQLNLLMIDNAIFQVACQMLDLHATKKMIAENGLAFEANEWAKYNFVNNPEMIEHMKMLVIPALVLLAFISVHFMLMKRRPFTSIARFELFPIIGLEAMNVFMTICILILINAGQLSKL